MEVILAIALTLALMAGVMGLYRYAMNTRDGVAAEAESVAAQRRVMEAITADLRQAIVYPFTKTGLTGELERMRFVSATLPSLAVWLDRGATDEPIAPESDLQMVGYRIRYAEDELGDLVAVGIERTCQKVLTQRAAEEGEEIPAELLTGHVRFLRLRYFSGGEWVESWSGGDLPAAVEIALGAQPLAEETDPLDYPHETFRRVVYVPGSSQALSGGAVRGLGEEVWR
jgi:type II secretion system protein J